MKYTESDGRTVTVRCCSLSLTKGKVKQRKRYTARTIDWIAVFDRSTSRCYYVPASELGAGREGLRLRLVPALNSQRTGIRFAEDYLTFAGEATSQEAVPGLMEPAGFEPAASDLQSRRSTN